MGVEKHARKLFNHRQIANTGSAFWWSIANGFDEGEIAAFCPLACPQTAIRLRLIDAGDSIPVPEEARLQRIPNAVRRSEIRPAEAITLDSPSRPAWYFSVYCSNMA